MKVEEYTMTKEQLTADQLIEQYEKEKSGDSTLIAEEKEKDVTSLDLNQLKVQETGKENLELRAYNNLNESQQELAQRMSESIDIYDNEQLMTYGSTAQSEVDKFSRAFLSKVKVSEFDGVGDSLNELMVTINDSNPSLQSKGFFSNLLMPFKKKAVEVQQNSHSVEERIDMIAADLEDRKYGLIEDTVALDELYILNADHHDKLNMYIAAGELKIKELEEETIPNAIDLAKETADQMDAQIVRDLNDNLSRLDKRIHDLRLTREITAQQAPQIRLIQSTNKDLAEKIQSSIMNTIPVWRNQFAIATALMRQESTLAVTKGVSDTTNEIMKRNSKMLNYSAIESAKETERGMIEIETLKEVQDDLINTIETTLKIQSEGRQARKDAEIELAVMEEEMKSKLLTLASENGAYTQAATKRKRKNVN